MRKRVYCMVSSDTMERWTNIPHGIRGTVLEQMVLRVIDVYEEHGAIGLGALVDGQYKFVPGSPEDA